MAEPPVKGISDECFPTTDEVEPVSRSTMSPSCCYLCAITTTHRDFRLRSSRARCPTTSMLRSRVPEATTRLYYGGHGGRFLLSVEECPGPVSPQVVGPDQSRVDRFPPPHLA